MKDFSSDIDFSSKRRNDALLAHANSENRDLAAEVANSIIANSGICIWMSRSRTDNELGRVLGYQLIKGDFVISVD